MLWIVWLVANVGMWMTELAAAWLMTLVARDPALIALVRTASTLPVFLLAVPSGAVADIVDRRRWLLGTQLWTAAVATLLAFAAWRGALPPSVLLALVFAYGAGLALRWPVYAAIVPEVVPRADLAQAISLNSVAANLSRVIGPAIAGALLAFSGSASVFAFNAALSVCAAVVVWRWRHAPLASALPGERFVGAMRVGFQYVAQSPPLRVAMVRSFVFFMQANALMALLPLIAQGLEGGEGTYSILMACMGAGAVAAAAWMPRLRSLIPVNALVDGGALIFAACTVAAAYAPTIWIVGAALLIASGAWIGVSNALMTSAQLALPDWVRARGMAMLLMSVMAGSAIGAAIWGAVAGFTGVPASLALSSLVGALLVGALRRLRLTDEAPEDLKAEPHQPQGMAAPPPGSEDEPVMVMIEYVVDDRNAAAFAQIMSESRRARLRGGALSWGLLSDASDPRRHVEYFVDENWVEHQRRLQRLTAADARLRERRLALHEGPGPPRITRYIGRSVSH